MNHKINYAFTTDRKKLIKYILFCAPAMLALACAAYYCYSHDTGTIEIGHELYITDASFLAICALILFLALIVLLTRLKKPQTLLVTDDGIIYNGHSINRAEIIAVKIIEIEGQKALGFVFTQTYLRKLSLLKQKSYEQTYKWCGVHWGPGPLVAAPETILQKLADHGHNLNPRS